MNNVRSHKVKAVLVHILVEHFCGDKSVNVGHVDFIQNPDKKVDVWQPSLRSLKCDT